MAYSVNALALAAFHFCFKFQMGTDAWMKFDYQRYEEMANKYNVEYIAGGEILGHFLHSGDHQ